MNGAEGPLGAYIPVLLSDDGRFADLHLARSILIVGAGLPATAVLMAMGPDAYVSDWSGADDQVPIWNDVAVHLRGVLGPLPDAALPDDVDALSAEHEARMLPKKRPECRPGCRPRRCPG